MYTKSHGTNGQLDGGGSDLEDLCYPSTLLVMDISKSMEGTSKSLLVAMQNYQHPKDMLGLDGALSHTMWGIIEGHSGSTNLGDVRKHIKVLEDSVDPQSSPKESVSLIHNSYSKIMIKHVWIKIPSPSTSLSYPVEGFIRLCSFNRRPTIMQVPQES